jgi:hypothetical protein
MSCVLAPLRTVDGFESHIDGPAGKSENVAFPPAQGPPRSALFRQRLVYNRGQVAERFLDDASHFGRAGVGAAGPAHQLGVEIVRSAAACQHQARERPIELGFEQMSVLHEALQKAALCARAEASEIEARLAVRKREE